MLQIADLNRVAFGLFALFLINAAVPADAGGPEEKKGTIEFNDCQSGTLRLVLNDEDHAHTEDLIQALRLFAEYPDLRYFPVRTPVPHQAAFLIRAVQVCAMDDAACADSAGWTELQQKLDDIPNMDIRCVGDTSLETSLAGSPKERSFFRKSVN